MNVAFRREQYIRILYTTIRGIILALIVVLTLFPIVWIVLTAFKDGGEIFAIPPTFIIRKPTIANFIASLTETPILMSMWNSIVVAVMSTILALIISAPAAYIFSRYRTRLSSILLMIILMVRMVPRVSLSLPFFTIMRTAGLLNSLTALVITYLTFQVPFAIWLMEGFFRSLPLELEEAAAIDGCSRFRAFCSIIMPVAANGLATVAIFTFIGSWNEFLYAVTLTRTASAQTGPVVIASNITSYQIFWGRMAASAVLFIIPVVAFNFLFQRHIVRGLLGGSVKG